MGKQSNAFPFLPIAGYYFGKKRENCKRGRRPLKTRKHASGVDGNTKTSLIIIESGGPPPLSTALHEKFSIVCVAKLIRFWAVVNEMDAFGFRVLYDRIFSLSIIDNLSIFIFKPILRIALVSFKESECIFYKTIYRRYTMPDLTHIHPMLVHFPIALLLVGFLSETIGLVTKKEFFSTAGFYLLLLGAMGVVAAYLSGENAGSGITEVGGLKLALETHQGAAEITLWLAIIAAVVRIAVVLIKKYSGMYKSVAYVIFLCAVLSVARTGFYGGELVYKHAAGVQLNLGFDSLPADSSSTESENKKED